MEDSKSLDNWAIVELYGYNKIAGKVTEQTIAGKGFIRIDVPAVGNFAAQTKFQGVDSIYSIIPTTEEVVRGFLQDNQRMQDIQLLQYSLPSGETAPFEGIEDPPMEDIY